MDKTKNIFILTGAGISKESGIKTFREKDGLWDNHRIEDVCTVQAFLENPNYVNKFYNDRKKAMNNPSIKPNKGHQILSKVEKDWVGEFMLVTQNIDNLHEKAGSKKVFHMHGSLEKAYCMNCNCTEKLNFDLSTSYKCSNCGTIGKVRVDVVWFGEQPKYLDQIYNFLDKTDIFVSIGTSNNVYPAAGFIDYLSKVKRKVNSYEFNIEKTNKSLFFKESIIGPASFTLEEFFKDFF
jgi:NAD-dependent deacetylase